MTKPFAITLDVGSSRANHTGTWRVDRPVYVDLQPPCNAACPAGEDIQGWLYRAEEGDYEGAWRRLVEVNPLPAVMGRVCFHPCETACNRGRLDEAVGIHAVERFLGDQAIDHGWTLPDPAPSTGSRVLVVGSGPSGLSAAYHLRRLGHDVTIHEAQAQAGGMMRYGIPAYRLPRRALTAEIERIERIGVTIVTGSAITDLAAAKAQGGFDAVFVAVGAHVGRHADIPSGDAARVLDAVSLLRATEEGHAPALGRRVAVYGGGDTAMDAARVAKRLGATDAVVVYRRTRDRMPAHDVELDEAVAEGVQMRWLSTVANFEGRTLTVERMVLDGQGSPQPTGELEELGADTLVLALGQSADLALLEGVSGVRAKDGMVDVDRSMMTGHAGVFAGGDMVPDERTVTVAVGHGRRAARHIDDWLAGRTAVASAATEPATFERLNTWYYADAPRTVQGELDLVRRQSNFAEVVHGLDETTALFEARRCLSCGNCFECDNCYGVCPDNAVIKLGPGRRYAFDYDFCKGCGLCVAECPCGAITMTPERI